MTSTLRLAFRNLLRYQRRTLLTALLIMLGVIALLLFVAGAGSFKQTMIGSITDSMLGHLQSEMTPSTIPIAPRPTDQTASHAGI